MAHDSEAIALDLLLAGLPAPQAEYLKVVADVLRDRKLTAEERDRVVTAGKTLGLNRHDRQRLHGSYLRQIALSMLGQGATTDPALPELQRLSRLLGLPEDAAGEAWESATRAADELAALILATPTAEPESKSLLGGLVSKATATTSGIWTIAGGLRQRDLDCEKCGKATPHQLGTQDRFPIADWLKLAWAAKTFSPADYALNVAKLAIQDRRLMEQTGRGLLPVYRCSVCSTMADRWVAAKLVVGTLSLPRPDRGVQPDAEK